MGLLRFAGRAALGIPFIILGFDAAKEPGARVDVVREAGFPYPEETVRANGAAMVLGGAALTLGILPRAAALGLVASLVPTTVTGHAFWKIADDKQRKVQQINFLKNLGMAGGLIAVATSARK
ncbi:MAG: DoxX family protein [Actinomycetaceae bacterium]|nr:DoxX family protein [Arcanobacterium sp.]MDD7504724.1 DoxX family protein [Actinomycetaceae bacterium]MDY6143101.1 DoxX family protein [Arcanobacterium sp.]